MQTGWPSIRYFFTILMVRKVLIKALFLTIAGAAAAAQLCAQADSLKITALDSVTISAFLRQTTVHTLPDVQGTYIFSGRKTEVIDMHQAGADITNKIGRQVFARIPGIFVYDMDGSGNQVNIAARGLDPHRGWEFNLRKDGIITNSDMYGYPASHYSMPLESIGHIELVRGTGSLQYGAQFGGMLNYVSKQGDTTKPFSFESISTAGSFNLLSTFNAIGGKLGKLKYYAYISKKSRGGYRNNEHTDSEAENIALSYDLSSRLSLRAEWARSTYRYRIPGPLNDAMFYADPRQATRSRNYFSPDIHIPSVVMQWKAAANTRVQLTTSAVLGRRNSVMFDKPANVADTITAATLQYNNRQVDIDAFHSYTAELRILQQYRLGRQKSALAAGAQYMNNDLHRTQLGKGTTGSDYDLTLVTPGWGRDMHFKTKNLALFAENKFQLTERVAATLGMRAEMGQTALSGVINYYPGNQVPLTIRHHYPLFGGSLSYRMGQRTEWYGGWAQAYHPMLFKDLFPASLYEKVDPNIKDARGYNAEIGFRGNWHFLRWDVTAFLLQYKNRFGTLSFTDNTGSFYTYRTNIGNSLTKGLEVFAEAGFSLGKKSALSVFTSTSFSHARYTNAVVKAGNLNKDIHGNKVESAPDLITRNGATFRMSRFSIAALFSYTAATYADALNTVQPAAGTGAVGLVPSYSLLDINAGFRLSKMLELKLNASNITNRRYFTKRPSFYPGPGIWPSDGCNFSASVVIKL